MYDGNVIPNIENNKIVGILNFFETGEYIIFLHRTLALFILVLVVYINYVCLVKSINKKKKYLLLLFNLIFIIQIILGILMTFQNIPWHLALAHHGNYIILFLVSIIMWILIRRPLQKNSN